MYLYCAYLNFVPISADISALSQLQQESAEISAVRYTNLNFNILFHHNMQRVLLLG